MSTYCHDRQYMRVSLFLLIHAHIVWAQFLQILPRRSRLRFWLQHAKLHWLRANQHACYSRTLWSVWTTRGRVEQLKALGHSVDKVCSSVSPIPSGAQPMFYRWNLLLWVAHLWACLRIIEPIYCSAAQCPVRVYRDQCWRSRSVSYGLDDSIFSFHLTLGL